MEHPESMEENANKTFSTNDKKEQTEKNRIREKDFCDFLRIDPAGSYDNLPFGYLLLNGNGRIINANISAAGMMDIEKADLIGTSFIRFVYQDDQKMFGKENADPSDWPASPVDIRLDSGKKRMWARFFFSDDKELEAAGGMKELIFHDITEYKQVEKENSELRQQLRYVRETEANRESSCEIAYDFNTIFYPIIGHLEILIKNLPEDSEIHFSLQNILTACRRAKTLAGKMSGSGRQAYSAVCPVSVQNVLQEVIELGRSIQPANIKIFKAIDKDCPPVMADPAHICQIAINLITYAFHVMKQNGGVLDVMVKEIDLSGKVSEELGLSPGKYVRLSVSDTGRDVDKSIKNKIFRPDVIIKGKENGTGQRLNVISGIVKEYGGIFCYSSKNGKGNRFEIYLPLAHYACSTDWITDREKTNFSPC